MKGIKEIKLKWNKAQSWKVEIALCISSQMENEHHESYKKMK